MTLKRKKKLKIVFFILLATSMAVTLLISALGQNMNHYYELSAIEKEFDSNNNLIGKTIRIGGMIRRGSIKKTPHSLKVSFKITNYSESINVEYEGVLPDLFKEGQGVLAKGQLIDRNHFKAIEILSKHDENYMPKEVQEELEKSGYYQHYDEDNNNKKDDN